MASQFALSDRWFSPVSSKSIPNRLATISGGTSLGYVFDPGADDQAPQLGARTVFELLDDANISWKIYYAHTDPDGSPSTTFKYFSYSNKFIVTNASGALVVDNTHIAPISQYFTDVQNRALPQFAYIEPNFGAGDEHPGSGQSILSGQQQVASIINALLFSPSWDDSVFFLSFDEAGGPYDHVPPVPGVTNQNTDAMLSAVEGCAVGVCGSNRLPCTEHDHFPFRPETLCRACCHGPHCGHPISRVAFQSPAADETRRGTAQSIRFLRFCECAMGIASTPK